MSTLNEMIVGFYEEEYDMSRENAEKLWKDRLTANTRRQKVLYCLGLDTKENTDGLQC